jgi:hypothetical protein
MVMRSDAANLALYISSSDSVTEKSSSEISINRPVLAICDNKHSSPETQTYTTSKDLNDASIKHRRIRPAHGSERSITNSPRVERSADLRRRGQWQH